MGRILAPYGVRGWVKIRPYTEAPDGLLGYARWWVGNEGAWQPHALKAGREHGELLVAQLEGIEDRDRAAALRGLDIAVGRDELPPAPEGEYYWADLVGLAVVNSAGVDFGHVAEVFETGANDVLVVRGDRERLIPMIAAAVVEVDLAGGVLRVDWDADF